VNTPGIQGSMAEEKKVMGVGDEKFTGIVGMSQWITANTCARLGIGSKEYELIMPPVSDDEAAFAYHMFSQEKPSGYYLGKDIERLKTLLPKGGFKYNPKPSVTLEELSRR